MGQLIMVEPHKMKASSRMFSVAAGLGALTIAILVLLGVSAPQTGCGGVDLSPVMAFQAVRASQDLASIFGQTASACRLSIVDGLRTGSQADLFLFIPVYAIFLAVVAATIPKLTKTWTMLLFAALIVTVIGDIVETSTQLGMLSDLNKAPSLITSLQVGNGTKTVGLSLFLFGIAFLMWKQANTTARIIAMCLGLLALGRLAGYLIESIQALAPLSALGAFSVLWAYSILGLMKRRKNE
jgi:hypothetical protein